MNEQQEFATLMVAMTNMVPGFILGKEMLAIYDEAARKSGYRKFSIALKQIMTERSSRDPFPAIKDILSRTEENALDPEEIASKIAGAVSKFGWNNGTQARAYMGEIGWDIVQIEGGWENVCQALSYENMPTYQAQWRNLARAMITRKANDRARQIGLLEPVGQTLKLPKPEGKQ